MSICNLGKWLSVSFGTAGVVVCLVSCGGNGSGLSSGAVATKATVGKALFFDKTLSNPGGMACATCHSPSKAFTDPRGGPTSEGVIKGLFGFRKAPSIQYMAFSPTFDATGGPNGTAIGGQFWDGRAADLPSQAKQPFLNPIEMNNTSVQSLIDKVKSSPEASGLRKLYGPTVFSDPNVALDAVVDAIASFERTPEVSPFTSKYDLFLKGKVKLTAAEATGLSVFNGPGQCFNCHSSQPLADGTPPLFTNFQYANIGVPKNVSNPYYSMPAKFNPLGANFIDYGLSATTGRDSDKGLFMVPSLRNVALRAPYFHSGGFNSLAAVVLFYNTSQLGFVFGPPEVPQNVNSQFVGNLQLSTEQTAGLNAFLQTLTDGYQATP